MAAVALSSATPGQGSAYYLDTSAVLSLAAVKASAAGQTVPPLEIQRATAVKGLADKCAAVGGRVFATMLALEEVAHAARARARKVFTKSAGFNSWRDLEEIGTAAQQSTVKGEVHSAILQGLEWAVTALADAKVLLDRPAVNDSVTAKSARTLRKAHRRFIRTYPGLDPMDALHLAVGLEMGAKDFVSFDAAWRAVTEVTVYHL